MKAVDPQHEPLVIPDRLRQLPSFLMFEIVRTGKRRATELFPDERLRLPHMAVLICLADFGSASQKDISERLRIDAGDLVTVLDTLEHAGYVRRQRDAHDRRRYALVLTPAGRRALQARYRRAKRLNEVLFATLSAAERDVLHGLLLRILASHDLRFSARRGSR